MSSWEELVSAALLGTSRREVDTAPLPEPVRSLANGADPERTLLSAAALLAGYRRAGRLAVSAAPTLSIAPQDDRALIGMAARRRLALFLSGDVRLLPEWLAAVATRGLRVPPERLPALADLARTRPELRTAVAAVAGTRGPWLAGLRPEWAFLTGQDGVDPSVWEYGTVAQRVAWLAATRTSDPAAARAALTEAWPNEPGPVRVQFLETVRSGLSGADEEFLEAALDDRARDVRRIAAELLAALPDSALSQRMADRVRPLIAVRRGTLVVDLPADCDDIMRRDGVTVSPPAGVGRRAWWLGQLVSAAPLAVWAQLSARPERLVRLPVEGCDPRLLGLAWAAAAVREDSVEWMMALLDAGPAGAIDHIIGMPGPWPVEVGTHVLDMLAATTDQRMAAHVADLAGPAVPPECLRHPLTEERPGYDIPAWRRRLIQTLGFRREMYEELSPGGDQLVRDDDGGA